MSNQIVVLLNALHNAARSNSTRALIYQATVLAKQVNQVMDKNQIYMVLSRLSPVVKKLESGEPVTDIHITNSVGSAIKLLNAAKFEYDSQGQNSPSQFRSYAIRNITSRINRSSRESESMRDRKYTYSVGNIFQKSINKFTDGELKRINQLINSEPDDILSPATLNRIKLISIDASNRSDIDKEPMFGKWLRKKIFKKHRKQIKNDPLPINY